MKILVLGGSGMLGHQLCRVLSKRQAVWATFHDRPDAYERYQLLPGNRMIGGLDVGEWPLFSQTLKEEKPDVVVNAIGIVKQRDEAKQAVMSIEVNALFRYPQTASFPASEAAIRSWICPIRLTCMGGQNSWGSLTARVV
jgi:dTDP-4-dehydrorhamnose reductase